MPRSQLGFWHALVADEIEVSRSQIRNTECGNALSFHRHE